MQMTILDVLVKFMKGVVGGRGTLLNTVGGGNMHQSSLVRVFNALKRSKQGVPNWRLAGITLRYGARIKDLRDSGNNISTIRLSPGSYLYKLINPSKEN